VTRHDGLRVAIMTDEIGWHTRQLQAALRERGVVGRCVDLADCRIDTTAAPGTAWPSPASVARTARRRAGARHRRRQLRAGDQAAGRAARPARARRAGLQRRARHRAQRRQGDDQPAAARRRHADAADLGDGVAAQAQQLVMRESAAGHALVLKPLFGSQGKGLRWSACRRPLHPCPNPEASGPAVSHYLQRFVPPAAEGVPGFDWRVLVIGGRAVTAMRRVSEHWIHNVAQGARCEPAELTPELAGLAERAAAAAGTGLRRRRPDAGGRGAAARRSGADAGPGGQRRGRLARAAAVTASTSPVRWSTTCSTDSLPPLRLPPRLLSLRRAQRA
jgi:tetrahydromethanopterin:alpha-L-glutamate ligase